MKVTTAVKIVALGVFVVLVVFLHRGAAERVSRSSLASLSILAGVPLIGWGLGRWCDWHDSEPVTLRRMEKEWGSKQ